MLNYTGSGTHWKLHLVEHGKEFVETLWCKLFTNKPELMEFATFFSEDEDIVNSNRYANKKLENGLDGGSAKGVCKSAETRKKMSISRTGTGNSNFGKSTWSKGKFQTAESNAKRSAANKGTPPKNKGISQTIDACPHCDRTGGRSLMKRWHFDNCKQKGKIL